MARLTEKQQRFADEYLVDLNATQAAIRAGYSQKSAARIAIELLNKTQVSEYLQNRRNDLQSKLEITQEKVLEELVAIGFSKATDYVRIDSSGRVVLTPTANLSEKQQRAIASIKEGKYGIELRLYDKPGALQLLGQYLGIFDGKGAPREDPPEDGFVDALRGEAAAAWQD